MTLADYRAGARVKEQRFVRATLQRHDWHLCAAARDLGILPGTLRHVLRALDLEGEYLDKKRS
jgi:hypothetical protein